MVYDMERNQFPYPKDSHLSTINLKHISSVVEVNQLANRDGNKLWIHTDPITTGKYSNISTEVTILASLQLKVTTYTIGLDKQKLTA